MKILYIPLDERPCNLLYPRMIAKLNNSFEVITPPTDIMPKKKKPANLLDLFEWLNEEIMLCDAAIISIDMLIYGGLLPSRIHYLTEKEIRLRLNKIASIKKKNPSIVLYAFNLIMRTPQYNSSEEEPDYYEKYGLNIFEYGWLLDKSSRDGLTDFEVNKLEQLKHEIPTNYIKDYEHRRKLNLHVNKTIIQMVEDQLIDFLVIPQDDSALYGYTAMDQQKIMKLIMGKKLYQRIHTYPGADEAGCTLLGRLYTQYKKIEPSFYVIYSSILGPKIIPKYEDRPIHESVKSHILAIGGKLADSPRDADIVLAINTPGKTMMEAWEQNKKDISYTSHRNLKEFVRKIDHFLCENKKCIVADVAYSNGGDEELVSMLDNERILDRLTAYAGWNTTCNTLGTVLATGVFCLKSENNQSRIYNLIYRIIEDWGYQGVVRKNIIDDILPKYNATYYNFNNNDKEIMKEIKDKLELLWNNNIQFSFSDFEYIINRVNSPWNRMFEIGLDLDVLKVEK